jgi:dipeptidyl aminopeptidase/acylaminoacyl peptidase
MNNIEVLPARRPDDALHEIVRRSRGLRRRRTVFRGSLPAAAIAAVVVLVATAATGDPTAVDTTGVAEPGHEAPGSTPTSASQGSTTSTTPSEAGDGDDQADSSSERFTLPNGPSITVPGPLRTTTTTAAPNAFPRQQIAHRLLGDGNWWQVWVSDIDGTNARQVTSGYEMHSVPTWSPNGDRLAYVEEKLTWDIAHLRIARVAGSSEHDTIKTWPHDREVSALQWSPDGARIFYVQSRENGPIDSALWSIAVDGSDDRKVFADVRMFDIAPNGERYAVVRTSGLLEIVRPDGTVERQLGSATAVAWSSDGSRLAVIDGGRGYVLNVSGTDRRAITAPPPGEIETRVSWRGAGDIVAVERQQGNVDACIDGTCASRGIRLIDVGSTTLAEYRLTDVGGHPALAP